MPADAQLTCKSDADCPSGFRCNADTQLCANLENSPPTSAPTLLLPGGQTSIKSGDLVTVGGTCDADARINRVRLVNAASGEDLQDVPVTAVANSQGTLSGSFVAGALPDGASISVEVVVEARGYLSVAANSRSLPLGVDLAAPAQATLAIASNARVTNAEQISLTLSAVGATEVYLDGDIVDAANVRHWQTYTTSADVVLTAGDATKVVIARYRDGAHNEFETTAAIELDTRVPTSQPTLLGPKAPLAKVRNGDTVTVQGFAEAGTVISSAHLLATDSQGTPLSGPGCTLDVTSQVELGSLGNFSGSFGIGTPCNGASAVALEVVVQNLAGTRSLATQSVSGLLALDNQAPLPATASLQAVALSRPGYSRFQDVVLLLDAELDGTVQILIQGNVQSGARVGGWVDFPGPESVPGQEPVTLTSTDLQKTITVTFRDELGNESEPVPVNLTLDRVAPPPPVGVNLQLVKASPAPRDPAQIDDSLDTFTLSGLNGAVVNGDRIEVFSDASLLDPLLILDVDDNGAFPATALTYNAGETYYAVAIDAAGNQSASATPLTVPQLSGLTVSPVPARAQVPVTVQFSSDVPLANAPTVTIDGQPASCGPPTGLAYSCQYTPDGSEAEGANAAVVRVIAHDGTGQMAPTTEGTHAITTTLDFHPPVLVASAVSVTQNDPGTADTISGAAGAVSDNIAASSTLIAHVSLATGGVIDTAVRDDGSFGPVAIGKNTNASVGVTVEDPAGNVSSGATFANDIAPPTISGLGAAPSAQHAGALVTVSFSVSDDAHDLRSAPVVTVAGNPATLVSGTLGTSDGQPHPFSYQYLVDPADAERSQPVVVTATDAVGNPQTARTTVLVDSTAPTSANTTPGNRPSWNGSPGVLGTAFDSNSGIFKVELSLESLTDGKWWDGTGFNATSETWLDTTGKTSWSFSTAGIPFVALQSYRIHSRATDLAGNVESPVQETNFSFDSTLPDAPSGLTATAHGAHHIDLSWPAVSGADHYLVYYDTEAGSRPPYAGTGATQGSSPISVTSGTTLAIDQLPRGRYVFAVTAVDLQGHESGYSPQAAAASRWWKWSAGSLSSNNVNRVISTGTGHFVAVGDGGTVWLSSDGGATWALHATGAGGDLLDVVQATSGLVAVGTTGVLQSTDGGATWSLKGAISINRNAATDNDLTHNPLAYANGDDVVVPGTKSSGNVLVSHDGGATFSSIQLSTSNPFTIDAISGTGSTMVVFAEDLGHSGSGVYRSGDGGATWSTPTYPGGVLHYVYFDGIHGVAGGLNGALVVSSDSGANWATPAAGSPFTKKVDSVFGSGSLVFAVADDGSYARSPDDGASWTPSFGHGGASYAGWTDGTTVLVGGAVNQKFYTRSTDSGLNWTTFAVLPGANDETDPSNMVPNLFVSDGTNLVASGSGLARSTDLGAHFATPPQFLQSASTGFWHSGHRIAAPGLNGSVAISSDDGDSWTFTHPGFSSIWLVGGDDTALLIGGFDASARWRLARSTDGGATFSTVGTWVGGPQGFSGLAISGSTWLVTCTNGDIVISTDGGLSWPTVKQPTTNALDDVRVIGGAWVAYGASGTIVRSTDSGATWSVLPPITAGELQTEYDVPGLMLLGTNNGQILKSVDNGASFALTASASMTNVNALWSSSDQSLVIAAGAENGADEVATTLTVGTSWTQAYSNFVTITSGTKGVLPVTGDGFYAFATGGPLFSADGSSWALVPTADVLPVPLLSTTRVANADLTALGMPFTVLSRGALVYGPP